MPRKIVYLSDDDDDSEEISESKQSTSFIYSKISKLSNIREKLANRHKYINDIFKDETSLPINDLKIFNFETQKKNKIEVNNDDSSDIEVIDPEVINLSDSEDSNKVSFQQCGKRKLNSKRSNSAVKKQNLTQQNCPVVDDVTEQLFQKIDESELRFKQSIYEDLMLNRSTNNMEPEIDDEASYEKCIDSRPFRIKIKRLDKVEYFSLMRAEPISTILDQIGQRFNIPVPKIILYLNDNIVDAKATPKSLNLSVADIFDLLCRYDAGIGSSTNETSSVTKNDDPNFIQLFLRDDSKKRMSICINRFELVRRLAEFYSKEKNISVDKITLEFDSDKMSLESKIDTYDMENDDQVDVIIKP